MAFWLCSPPNSGRFTVKKEHQIWQIHEVNLRTYSIVPSSISSIVLPTLFHFHHVVPMIFPCRCLEALRRSISLEDPGARMRIFFGMILWADRGNNMGIYGIYTYVYLYTYVHVYVYIYIHIFLCICKYKQQYCIGHLPETVSRNAAAGKSPKVNGGL